jgi:prepilin-type N-terminal cleavage/methylation domain-containing protein
MKKKSFTNRKNPVKGLLKPMITHFGRYRINGFAPPSTIRERSGFTLLELIIATSILSIIALLIYPAYRTSSRSYQLSVVQSNLQQNARIGMKKMVKEVEAAMVVIPEEGDEATDGSGNNYGYEKGEPYKIAFYIWDSTPEEISDNDKIAIYWALPSLDVEVINPASISPEDKPLLYARKYTSSSPWSNPEPLVLSDVKVTQLNFIIGGDNEDEILITLELAQAGPLKEWRTFKLVSAAKLGAR